MKAWNWFLAHGDKVLGLGTMVLTGLATAGVVSNPISAAVLATLTFIHTTFLPEPTSTPAILPQTTGTKVNLHWLTVLITLVLASALVACASTQTALDSPLGQAAVGAGVQVAVTTAEQHGVSAGQINSVAKAVLADTQGVQTSLAALNGVINVELVKLKIPSGDIQAFQILESAFDVWLAVKYGNNPTIAQVQGDLAQWLNLAIADTGG